MSRRNLVPIAGPSAETSTQLADDRTRLALDRTRLALDRTLLAWVRTATALISFGFTIYKFFQNLPAPRTEELDRVLLGPRGFALVMIALGVGGLGLASRDYHRQMEGLLKKFVAYGPFERSKASTLAAVISGLGVLGFLIAFLRR